MARRKKRSKSTRAEEKYGRREKLWGRHVYGVFIGFILVVVVVAICHYHGPPLFIYKLQREELVLTKGDKEKLGTITRPVHTFIVIPPDYRVYTKEELEKFFDEIEKHSNGYVTSRFRETLPQLPVEKIDKGFGVLLINYDMTTEKTLVGEPGEDWTINQLVEMITKLSRTLNEEEIQQVAKIKRDVTVTIYYAEWTTEYHEIIQFIKELSIANPRIHYKQVDVDKNPRVIVENNLHIIPTIVVGKKRYEGKMGRDWTRMELIQTLVEQSQKLVGG